jgi:hypothetical protein
VAGLRGRHLPFNASDHPEHTMTDKTTQNAVQATIQPFIKLVQANMELLNGFSSSLELSSAASSHTSNPIQQAQENFGKLMQNQAMTTLMQGLLKNYTEFMHEFSQGGMALMTHTHDTLQQQGRAAADHALDATHSRVRHVRSVAG